MKENKQPRLEKFGEHDYRFIDIYDKESESFFYAEDYKNGFALVKKTEHDPDNLYRDMVGNITPSCHTIIGTSFFNFAHNYTKFESLPAICFINENFFHAAHLLLLDKIARQIELKTQKGKHIDIKMIKTQKDRALEMCNTKRQAGIKIMEKRANEIHKSNQHERE